MKGKHLYIRIDIHHYKAGQIAIIYSSNNSGLREFCVHQHMTAKAFIKLRNKISGDYSKKNNPWKPTVFATADWRIDYTINIHDAETKAIVIEKGVGFPYQLRPVLDTLENKTFNRQANDALAYVRRG